MSGIGKREVSASNPYIEGRRPSFEGGDDTIETSRGPKTPELRRAISAVYDKDAAAIVITFDNGFTRSTSPVYFRHLANATHEQIAKVELSGYQGNALRWDELDVDYSITAMVGELLGLAIC